MSTRMNLQLFAEATPGDNGDGQGTAPAQQQTPPAGQPAQPAEPPAAPQGKTYTEAEYLAMSSSQYSKGMAKIMKDAGYELDKKQDFEAQLAAFKQWQDGQKSELQLAQEKAGKVEEKDAEIDELKAQIEASKIGVAPEFAPDVILLAKQQQNYKDDRAAAIKAVLEKYPHFKGQQPNTTQVQNPGGGAPPAGTEADYKQRYAEAMKARNTLLAVQIKNEAAKSKIFF
ncbi:hypothetical protein LJC07_04530 [Christensenellaceae bacterium OttesenSCG-928-L17]|nr:hypothetical protein [Christensenellaceae bacterium OttesenSCG-928-L17]